MKQILSSKQNLLRLRTLRGRTSERSHGRERPIDLEQDVQRATLVMIDRGVVNRRALLSTRGDKR